MDDAATPAALAGLRVLELGQLLAGPYAGFVLAGFGAEVIKVEPPGDGDPLRRWRKLDGDTSLWWRSLARNKRCVTADLRQEEGRALVRKLVAQGIDIVIENFRPGRLERWGLGPADLWAIDPRIIVVRISGYGQHGPKAQEPGFANVAEAFGGLRYTTGEPDRPPVRAGISLGDTLTGLHAALGAMIAVHERGRSGRGQVIDCALYESVFQVMESLVPEYDRLGFVRERSGSALPGIVPSNTYRCTDGWLVLGANNDSLFQRLMHTIGRDDLGGDPTLARNDGRVAQTERIDAAIAAWASTRALADALAQLALAEVPSGPIYSIADIFADPHYAARGMLERITLPDGSTLAVPRLAPLLSRTPAQTRHAGGALGADNDAVWGALGLDHAALAQLRSRGVI
ncbi:MAG: CoA transferase [Deltaproteobacteria bacterium]|nr:CoA transferase [Deltaproteobacteria bacterium]MBK8718944.1 CoA transferase [Deltaproteobacteria bacterium]